jgi:homoserine O-acetyltransferase
VRLLIFAVIGLSCVPRAHAQALYPAPVDGTFLARDVRFDSGEAAAEIRLHYRTVGRPRPDADGVVRNGVLILHGTGGSGRGFLSDG